MAAVLVVCTGNVCRSPLAEGFLRAAFRVRFGDGAPDVESAGTSGWEGSRADPGSVAAAAERNLDISSHRARRLSDDHLDAASLVLTMAAEHRDAIVGDAPRVRDRAFSLKELVRLLEALPAAAPPSDAAARLSARVGEAEGLRRSGFEGNPLDEDVMDPLGLPFEAFRAVAWELQTWCDRLARGLFGPAPAAALSGSTKRPAGRPSEEE